VLCKFSALFGNQNFTGQNAQTTKKERKSDLKNMKFKEIMGINRRIKATFYLDWCTLNHFCILGEKNFLR